jgi:serine/threonine protein kinase
VLKRRTVIEGFEVQEMLRSGPRGAVYEAVQGSLLRTVALRLLDPKLSEDTEFVARFWRQEWPEHPHIVPVYEAGESSHGLFVAMQLITGDTLAELLARDALDRSSALTMLTQVAGALDAAHESGIAHGWLRGEAVLVDETGRPWLSDFGLTPGAATPEGDMKDFTALVRTCLGRRAVPRGRFGTASELMSAVAARERRAQEAGGSSGWKLWRRD